MAIDDCQPQIHPFIRLMMMTLSSQQRHTTQPQQPSIGSPRHHLCVSSFYYSGISAVYSILCHILQIVSRERSSKKRKNQRREVSSVMMMSVTFRHHPSKGRRAATLLLLLFFTLHVRIVEINNVMYR